MKYDIHECSLRAFLFESIEFIKKEKISKNEEVATYKRIKKETQSIEMLIAYDDKITLAITLFNDKGIPLVNKKTEYKNIKNVSGKIIEQFKIEVKKIKGE